MRPVVLTVHFILQHFRPYITEFHLLIPYAGTYIVTHRQHRTPRDSILEKESGGRYKCTNLLDANKSYLLCFV